MGKFNLAVCGGTFDLFHAGHKAFINDALSQSEKVLLGITSDTYVQSLKNNLGIENFEIRKQAVQQYLKSINVSDRVQIVEINSAYEPYLETATDYQAIVVTGQTERTAREINAKRQQNGVPPLEIVISPIKNAEDGRIISSTRIRNGEINRDGRLYLNPQWQNKNLILPENLRPVLQKPWGEVLTRLLEHDFRQPNPVRTSRVPRHGKSRRCASYQPRSARRNPARLFPGPGAVRPPSLFKPDIFAAKHPPSAKVVPSY